jgi:hypothetical protein
MSWKARHDQGCVLFLFFFFATSCTQLQARVTSPFASEDVGLLPQFDGATKGDQPTAFKAVCIVIEMMGEGDNPEMRFTLKVDNVASSDPADQNIQTVHKALERLKVLVQNNRNSVALSINSHRNVQAGVLLTILEATDNPVLKIKTANLYYKVIDKP